jgi:hypothetical protein
VGHEVQVFGTDPSCLRSKLLTEDPTSKEWLLDVMPSPTHSTIPSIKQCMAPSWLPMLLIGIVRLYPLLLRLLAVAVLMPSLMLHSNKPRMTDTLDLPHSGQEEGLLLIAGSQLNRFTQCLT